MYFPMKILCWSSVRLLLIITFLLITFSSTIFAGSDKIAIDVEEKGFIIDFYNNYYIVNVNGTFSITNPSKLDIYGVEIPISMSTLQIEILNNTYGAYYSGGTIRINALIANSTLQFDYNLYGITSDKKVASEDGILYTAVLKDEVRLSSYSAGQLFKAPLEDVSEGGSPNTRLISVSVTSSIAVIFSFISINSWSATGQFGAVSVITISTLLSSFTIMS